MSNYKESFAETTCIYWSGQAMSISEVHAVLYEIFGNPANAEVFSYQLQAGRNSAIRRDSHMVPVYDAIIQDILHFPGLKTELHNLVGDLYDKKYALIEPNVFNHVYDFLVPRVELKHASVLYKPVSRIKTYSVRMQGTLNNIVRTYYREVYPIKECVRILIESKEQKEFLSIFQGMLDDPFEEVPGLTYVESFMEYYKPLIIIASALPMTDTKRLYYNISKDEKIAVSQFLENYQFGMKKKKSIKRSGRRKRKSGPKRTLGSKRTISSKRKSR